MNEDPNFRELVECQNCGREYSNVIVPVRCTCGERAGGEYVVARDDRLIFQEEFITDCNTLSSMLPPVRTVVGISRSGMLPAYVISMNHSADLWSFSEPTGLVHLGGGSRWSGYPSRDGISVLVDDSCYSGGSMSRAENAVAGRFPGIKFAAVYTSPRNRFRLDHYVHTYRAHWFEWNLGNTVWSHKLAFDIDGVLCPDFTREEDDDGPRYLERMITMPAGRIVPRTKPVHLITARLEKYREPTMQWLDKQGVRVAGLHMGPWQSRRAREKADIWAWKAEVLSGLPVEQMVESDDTGSRQISRYSGKQVICSTSGNVYFPDSPSRGFGDIIADMTHAIGIPQCGKCRNRQKTLNH